MRLSAGRSIAYRFSFFRRDIQEDALTDAEIQQGMLSGRLSDKLKQLSPDADQLFQEISTAIKEGTGPGQERVLPLLQGLGGQPN